MLSNINTTEKIKSRILNVSDDYEAMSFANAIDNLNKVKDMTELSRAGLLARSIEGINKTIENSLYSIQSTVQDSANTIRTLPFATFRCSEEISTIQPAAWICGYPGGLYDPYNNQISKNSVNHWEGKASSFTEHLMNCLKQPCFIAYHIITLSAIILSIVFALVVKPRKDNFAVSSIVLITLIVSLYDIGSMTLIILLEIFYPADKSPFEASKIQEYIDNRMKANINEMASIITNGSCDMNDTITNCRIVGNFILSGFFDPAIVVFKESLRLITPAKVPLMEWKDVQMLLSLYRFIREISSSDIDYENIDSEKLKFRRFLVNAIKIGSDDVHYRLLLLLSLALESQEMRSQKILFDRNSINLRHYIGSYMLNQLINDLKAIKRTQIKDIERLTIISEVVADGDLDQTNEIHTHYEGKRKLGKLPLKLYDDTSPLI